MILILKSSFCSLSFKCFTKSLIPKIFFVYGYFVNEQLGRTCCFLLLRHYLLFLETETLNHMHSYCLYCKKSCMFFLQWWKIIKSFLLFHFGEGIRAAFIAFSTVQLVHTLSCTWHKLQTHLHDCRFSIKLTMKLILPWQNLMKNSVAVCQS